jgi:hypothetical protein
MGLRKLDTMKNKIINWFKGWLGLTALEKEVCDLRNANQAIREHNQKLINQNKKLTDKFDLLIDQAQVGVDIRIKEKYGRNLSWAVVCLKGKQEYVQFFGLSDSDIRYIQDFLRPFGRRKDCIDAPFGYVDHLKGFNHW